MPQLEQIDTFLSQIVWLVITFGLLYLVMWKSALPRITDLMQERQERIDDDLQRAEDLKKEAEAVLKSYEAAVEKGRAEALSLLRETSERLTQEATERHESLTRRITADGTAAEARISEARKEALANVQQVAAEVAESAAAKLLGDKITRAKADTAVAAVMKERG